MSVTMPALFFAVAALAGLLQVHLLRRTALAVRVNPLAMLLRLLLVSAVLVAAAVAHCLVAAVLGWASAVALATVVVARRWS